MEQLPSQSSADLSYRGSVNITFQQSPSKDTLYFRIELENTVWTPFTGQHHGIQEQGTLDKWLWDPITPVYNPLVTLTNGICSYVFGKRPLSYHIDQASAFRALDTIYATYGERFDRMDAVPELQGLESIYCTPEGMRNYMDSRPRSRAAVLGTLLRDSARPVGSALQGEVRQLLPYYSFPSTTTPWTGMVGHMKESGEFVGRVANGGGRKNGYSESGVIYAPDKRGQRLGKEATYALAVHAWLFKNLQFPVGGHPVTHFTATVSPDNQLTTGLAKAFGAEVLHKSLNPYDKTSERHLYGIPAKRIDEVLRHLIPDPENQITINRQKPAEFFRQQSEE